MYVYMSMFVIIITSITMGIIFFLLMYTWLVGGGGGGVGDKGTLRTFENDDNYGGTLKMFFDIAHIS